MDHSDTLHYYHVTRKFRKRPIRLMAPQRVTHMMNLQEHWMSPLSGATDMFLPRQLNLNLAVIGSYYALCYFN